MAVQPLCAWQAPAESPHGFVESTQPSCRICHLCSAVPEAGQRMMWDSRSDAVSFDCFAVGAEGGSVSSLCLSCHDGVIAMTAPDNYAWFASPQIIGAIPEYRNRTGHHPHGIQYPLARGDAFALPESNRLGPLPLYEYLDEADSGAYVECATCHVVHGTGVDHALRVPHEHRELCGHCHRLQPALSRKVHVGMQVDQIDPTDCTACHGK